ncbi:hypothetical protein H072_6879 [Dactylellina haptotyla CBS 200.50]|uniref:Protein BIG1 n=1 Tax=Dactylellina haptotyla (strain CBS 200.50) TaxID=1284197 RepID=S8AE68_DACHA|nr:hypothetical protein H072_6879 [Dactylellina haptotyla CBS 200.50]
MRSGLYLAAALAPLVSAFADTSPLFLYSTERLPHSLQLRKYQDFGTAEQFLDAVKTTVSQCTSDAYILILQPGVHETDFRDSKSAPQIRKFSQSDSFVSVMDAVGYVDLNVVEDYVKSRCQAHTVTVDASTSAFDTFDENSTAQVIKLDFPVLPIHGEARKRGHIQNDNFLSALISMMPTTKYTVVYVSTPVGDSKMFVNDKKPGLQEHESFINHQTILQRDVPDVEARADDDKATGGLLSNYQFFTPVLVWSIFIVLFMIYVASQGLYALSSIKVSYGAVEKGPTAGEVKKHK